jgi:DNA replicative helicase MCM subunit Mcm2 (Cdc46/Mcm family)
LEFFLFLVNNLKEHAEQAVAFLKVILHLDIWSKHAKEVDIVFKNTGDIFSFNMRINTYIEFNGIIMKWTDLKIQNTRLNVYCTTCGIIYYKTITNSKDTKIFNHLLVNTDRKFHNCDKSESVDLVSLTSESSKLYKEFTNPILIRYLLVEIAVGKSVYCLLREGLFNNLPLGCPVRLTGIVKTKPDTVGNNEETFYEKIVEIVDIEPSCDQKYVSKEELTHDGITIGKYNISHEELLKFDQFSRYNSILTYYLVNIINPRIYINFDFFNVLLMYFLFGMNERFNIHIFDMNKNDNVSNCLKLVKGSFELPYHSLSNESKTNEGLVFNKEKDNNFDIKLGELFNSQNESLILDNVPAVLGQTLQGYIMSNITRKEVDINFNINESTNSSKFNAVCSFFTNTKNSKDSFSSFGFYNNFDIVYYNSDRIDSQKDRKKSNQIIENQFQKRKKYTQIDYSQLRPDEKVLNNFSSQDMYYLDNINYLDYYCNIMKNHLEAIRKDPFLSSLNDKSSFLRKYLLFVNTYVFPKLSTGNIDKIRLLSSNLYNSLFELIDNDVYTYEKINSNISKVAVARARMNMRESIGEDDIQEAYMVVKEVLQNNFVFSVNSRKEKIQKTKKNKITYVMDKIRQICSSTGSNKFSRINVKEACDFLSVNDDLEKIIETLNYHGFMIKLNTQEYQLIN